MFRRDRKVDELLRQYNTYGSIPKFDKLINTYDDDAVLNALYYFLKEYGFLNMDQIVNSMLSGEIDVDSFKDSFFEFLEVYKILGKEANEAKVLNKYGKYTSEILDGIANELTLWDGNFKELLELFSNDEVKRFIVGSDVSYTIEYVRSLSHSFGNDFVVKFSKLMNPRQNKNYLNSIRCIHDGVNANDVLQYGELKPFYLSSVINYLLNTPSDKVTNLIESYKNSFNLIAALDEVSPMESLEAISIIYNISNYDFESTKKLLSNLNENLGNPIYIYRSLEDALARLEGQVSKDINKSIKIDQYPDEFVYFVEKLAQIGILDGAHDEMFSLLNDEKLIELSHRVEDKRMLYSLLYDITCTKDYNFVENVVDLIHKVSDDKLSPIIYSLHESWVMLGRNRKKDIMAKAVSTLKEYADNFDNLIEVKDTIISASIYTPCKVTQLLNFYSNKQCLALKNKNYDSVVLSNLGKIAYSAGVDVANKVLKFIDMVNNEDAVLYSEELSNLAFNTNDPDRVISKLNYFSVLHEKLAPGGI